MLVLIVNNFRFSNGIITFVFAALLLSSLQLVTFAWLWSHVKLQQDKQYTYNVTLRRVKATIVAMGMQ
jgi:hypothetical protein